MSEETPEDARGLIVTRWHEGKQHIMPVEVCPRCFAIVPSNTEAKAFADEHTAWHYSVAREIQMANMGFAGFGGSSHG